MTVSVGSQENRDGHLLVNLWVHHNSITPNGDFIGVFQTGGNTAVFTRNNRFDHNTYHVADPKPYAWNNTRMTIQEWKAAGQDPNGAWE